MKMFTKAKRTAIILITRQLGSGTKNKDYDAMYAMKPLTSRSSALKILIYWLERSDLRDNFIISSFL
jgi:hypothetical protein